jgi:hypothetical protein
MRRLTAAVALSLLMASSANAELRHVELTIFGMD